MAKVDVVKEYVRKLNDEDLHFFYNRLTQRFSGDIPELLSIMQENNAMHYWLSSASNADELYDMIDYLQLQVETEFKKKTSTTKLAVAAK